MLTDDNKRAVARVVHSHAKRYLTSEEAVGRLRDVANATNLAEVLLLLPDDLASRLTASLAQQPPLKAVGYWRPLRTFRSAGDDRFPDPVNLLYPRWCPMERRNVVAYLRTGRTYNQCRGVSYCRFECGVSDRDMGSRCLTDGEWVWPEGLGHYVEVHTVRLPDEFIVSMRRKQWRMSRNVTVNRQEHGLPDTSFWVAWAQDTMQRQAEPKAEKQ
jgi:hypothetical protein